MAKKKSNAKIQRMKRRAAARGEEYHEPQAIVEERINAQKMRAAVKLRKELASIANNAELKAKERRSAKRKAEAIATEEAMCSAAELMEWYTQNVGKEASADKPETEHKKDKEESNRADESTAPDESDHPAQSQSSSNPYIVFVGQLSFTTTKEGLFQHFERELGKEHKVDQDKLRIRLLTDKKTKKSRGMAFVETADPDLLYACLKLHHTQLDGRRINVERTAGGKRNSKVRKSKINQYRKEQENYMSETVDKMLKDHIENGDLDENELDDGVVSLCKRHSATTVETALSEYIEARGRKMDNPSAYLTYIIGRIAADDSYQTNRDKDSKKRRQGSWKDGERKKREKVDTNNVFESASGVIGNKLPQKNVSLMDGVDMSISKAPEGGSRDLSKIFPSFGRGRGRGYM